MPPDTKPEELDPNAILQRLGFTEAASVTRAEGGTATDIWRVQTASDGDYALRLFHEGDDDSAAMELAAMQAASAAGLPVPTARAVGTWRGRPALLISWLAGRQVGAELRRAPWRVWSLGLAFGRMQAAIQALPAPEPLTARPHAWICWLGPDHRELAERLKREQAASALLHLDYHMENVLTDGQRIIGVLDWQNALAGPPRADAARTFAILTLDYKGHISLVERLVRNLFARAWRAGYEAQAGPLGDMSLYNAWAGAIMQRDLAGKRDARDLARIARWTDKQWARAQTRETR